MRAWQGSLGASDYRGIVSPAYVVVRGRERHEPRYFHYLFRTPYFSKEAERWSYGISSDQWSLRPEEFKQIYTCIPPFQEQQSIVRFLDDANHRIRRYIRAKQKLINLLNEQKQAVVERAATRGLGSDVPLRSIGVECFEEAPQNWDVLPLKSMVSIQSGLTLGKNYAGAQLTEYPYLRVANVQEGHLDLSTIKTQ
jgi:type I restriction enzyme S subunit